MLLPFIKTSCQHNLSVESFRETTRRQRCNVCMRDELRPNVLASVRQQDDSTAMHVLASKWDRMCWPVREERMIELPTSEAAIGFE